MAAEDPFLNEVAGAPRPGRRQTPAPGAWRWPRRPPPAAMRQRSDDGDPGRRRRRTGPHRLAVPRRRHGRGRHPARRRERQPPVGQPRRDPLRRLPPRPGVGNRRLAGHRGRRPAGRHHRPAVRGPGGRAADAVRRRPLRGGVLLLDHRARPRRCCPRRMPDRRASWRARAGPTSKRSPSSASGSASPSRSPTTCSTSSAPTRSSASRRATTSRRASTRCLSSGPWPPPTAATSCGRCWAQPMTPEVRDKARAMARAAAVSTLRSPSRANTPTRPPMPAAAAAADVGHPRPRRSWPCFARRATG